MKKSIALVSVFAFMQAALFASMLKEDQKNFSKDTKPLLFIENKGQVADQDGKSRADIKFTAQSNGVNLFFTGDGIYYQFTKSTDTKGIPAKSNLTDLKISKNGKKPREIFRLDMKLEGANPNPKIRQEDKKDYFENYYFDHCPQGITNVGACSKIVYENIYPKIDWVIYSNGINLEYDFVVHPGGNPNAIKIRYDFADGISIEKNGDAKIVTALGQLVEAAPVCFLKENKKNVVAKFKLDKKFLHIELDAYDVSKTLVIDPVLLWSTYYGGTSYDYGYACSTDTSGNVFVSGETDSNNGIATSGGFQSSHVAFSDGFISKFDANGVRLWATYFGAGDDDFVSSSACDKSGNIFIAGYTASSFGMSSSGTQNSFGGGQFDGFFAKFSGAGTRLWSSYYGGSGSDVIGGCATDASGNLYVSGTTESFNNISAGIVFQNAIGFGYDCFLAKFDAGGTRLWGSYFGGGGDDRGFGCATDKQGNVYFAGYTNGSSNLGFGGFQTLYNGSSNDALLVKFNDTGSLLWSTYYGDIDSDIGLYCTTDGANNVYLSGRTNSSFAIASSGFQNSYGGGISDGFLVKFAASGARLWGTYVGKSGEDLVQGCRTDSYNNVFVCGTTSSSTGMAFNGFQSTYGGGLQDGFVSCFSPTGTILFGSYLGGSGDELANSCTVDKMNKFYVTGQTASANFTTAGTVHQASFGSGAYDAFLSKIENPCISSVATINFSGTAYACASNTLLLQATSGVGYNYQWQLNGTTINGATSATYTATQGGNYALIVNQNGVCQDTSAILFVDSVPPSVPLCICTVDSLSKFNLLVWEKPPSTIIDSFRIYREDITNVFSYIKSVGYNQLSLFIDSNLIYANPNVTSKLYKISTVDVCGTESPKSPFHHTIKLNDQQNGNFDWNFYEIQGQTTPVLQYLLLRDSVSSGIWRTIAITSGNVNQISDPDYNLYPNSSYRVVTNLGSLNCTPTQRIVAGYSSSRSNIKNRTVGIQENQNWDSKIILAPNPASNFIRVTNQTEQKINSIRISDNIGRVVLFVDTKNTKTDKMEVNVTQLLPAVYTVQIEAANFVVTKKFVKN